MLQILLNVLLISFFLLCWLVRASHPLIADEVDFMKPLLLWVNSGPRVEGLWHGPIYPWILMIFAKGFGSTYAVARSIGAICIICAGLLAQRAAYIHFPKLKSYQGALLLALILFSPAILGASVLLDYDNTLLVLTTSSFFLSLIILEKAPTWRLVTVGGLWLGACLIAKETTPLLYPLALAVLLKRRGEKPLVVGFSVLSCLLVACATFLLCTWLWCKIYHVHMPRMFDLDVLMLRNYSFSRGMPWSRRLYASLTPLIWLGPGVLLLFYRAAKHTDFWRQEPALAGIAVAVLTSLGVHSFIFLESTYHFPLTLIPLFPWLIFLGFAGKVSESRDARAPANGILFFTFCVVWFALSPGPLELLYERSMQSLIIYTLTLGIPLAVVSFAKPRGLMLIIFSLCTCIPSVKQMLLTSRSVNYWYGNAALTQARSTIAPWIAKHPHATLYSPAKDIAYELKELGFEYQPRPLLAADTLELCHQKTPLLIVTRAREDSSLLLAPELVELKKCLLYIEEHGDLVLGHN